MHSIGCIMYLVPSRIADVRTACGPRRRSAVRLPRLDGVSPGGVRPPKSTQRAGPGAYRRLRPCSRHAPKDYDMRLPAAVAAALLTLPLALAGCSHTDVAACERAMRAALSR